MPISRKVLRYQGPRTANRLRIHDVDHWLIFAVGTFLILVVRDASTASLSERNPFKTNTPRSDSDWGA